LFLKNGRDDWKEKCRKAKKRLKREKEKNRRLKRRNCQLALEIKRLKGKINVRKEGNSPNDCLPASIQEFEHRPTFHAFSLAHIQMFLSLALFGCGSLRGASRSMEICFSQLNIVQPAPSWQAGRFWLLRIGLHKLIRAKEIANDWIWIVDHTVKLGREKCLAIFGVRRSQLPEAEAYIFHQDLEPIELAPVQKSNGDIVYEQLTKAIEKTGVPCQIVADHGTDVKAGIEKFCSDHPQTRYVYDIKHKVAALLKKELGGDDDWQEYAKACAAASKKLQQTELAHLAPPQQRAKAKYMNIEPLVQWGVKMLTLLEAMPVIGEELDLDAERVEQKQGWLRLCQQRLGEWTDLMATVKSVENYVKFVGIYNDCHIELEQNPPYVPHTVQAKAVNDQLMTFVKEQALKAEEGEWLLGSSEIIESAFGKLKSLEHEQVKGGFTGMLLSLSACVGTISREMIEEALMAIPTQKLLDWIRENIPASVQSSRRKLSEALKHEEQKRTQNLTPCYG
jgi:hypothetical protein